jgi:hypothetical protein
VLLEQAALALLDYVENSTDGFRILVRDSPAGQSTGSFDSATVDPQEIQIGSAAKKLRPSAPNSCGNQ